MIYVLPINEMSRSFHGQTLRFLEEKELDPSMFSFAKCEALVTAVLYRVLYDKFYWIPYEEERHHAGLSVNDDGAVVMTFQPLSSNSQLYNAEEEYVRALTRLFDWMTTDAEEEDLCNPTVLKEVMITNQYDSTVVDDVWLSINELVKMAIPEKTWKVWEVQRLGCDLYLKEGEDYRIKDWMKRHRGV